MSAPLTAEYALAVAFRNVHLSVSRLKLFEQCMRAFYLRYVENGTKDPHDMAAAFGTCLHAALELVYRWIVEEEHAGLFPTERLVAFYKESWQASALTGVALYQEGLTALRAYGERQATVDHLQVLAVEHPFDIEIDGYVVNGYVDLVEKINDHEIAVRDYKSNRALFTEDQLASDLQMSVYGLVVREFWPWATQIHFTFEMLRHNVRQVAVRTAAQLDDAAGYVGALGRRSEEARTPEAWRGTLNPLCAWCDHRSRCPEYKAALDGKEPLTQLRSIEGIDALARERERVSVLSNTLFKRRNELDKLLLAQAAKEGPFTAAGVQYAIEPYDKLSFPDAERVVKTFVQIGGQKEDEVRRQLGADPEKVEALRAAITPGLGAGRAAVLETTLKVIADHCRTPKWAKLQARPLPTKKTREDDLAKEAAAVAKDRAKETP